MTHSVRRLVVACAIAIAAVPVLFSGQVAAAGAPTTIQIAPVPDTAYDAKPVITVTLINASGSPLAAQRVVVVVDSTEPKQRRTDENGIVSIAVQARLAPGEHTVVARFPGTATYAAASVSTQFTVLRPEVAVQTVPALPGVAFTLGETTGTTGPDGVVRIPYDPVLVGQRPEPAPETVLPDGSTARFSRWYGSGQSSMKATFDVYYPITLSFHELGGDAVTGADIESIALKSSIGAHMEVEAGEPLLLQGSRVVPLAGGLESKDIYYTIESVTISGTNVVNRSQQRFVPSEARVWAVELLFYSAEFTVRDAIFGFSTGKAVSVEYPDGDIVHVDLGPDGTAFLPALPRGNYRVSVEGPGLGIWRPLALSRDQDVHLELVSFLDIGTVAGLGLSVLLGLLVVGRPSIRNAFGRWREPAVARDRILGSSIAGITIALVILTAPPLYGRYVEGDGTGAQADVPGGSSGSGLPLASPSGSPSAGTYRVREGDTLRSIADALWGDETQWARLLDANRGAIADPDALVVGQDLVVPQS